MGQAQTNQGSSVKRQNIENENPRINHPKFQNPVFEKTKNDQEIIKIKIPIANEKQFMRWSNDLKKTPLNSEVNFFPRNYSFKKQGFCGSSGYVYAQYDNFPFILADQIMNRQTLKQKYFQQSQLWYLIYSLLGAGKQFHSIDKKVGDIQPKNVFINEDGQVKVSNILTWPSQQVNYQKTFFQKQTTYLAPQQLRQIQFAKIQQTTDPLIAQSFSIGLTCLDAGTLTSSSSLYVKNNKFDYQMLENRLKKLRQIGYDQLIIMTIQSLCQIEPTRRGKCTQLFDWLSPYQEAIINLQPFQPGHFPRATISPSQFKSNLIMNQTPFQSIKISRNPIQVIQNNVNPHILNQRPLVVQSNTSSHQQIVLPASVNFNKVYPPKIISTNKPEEIKLISYQQFQQVKNNPYKNQTYMINETFRKQNIENQFVPRQSEGKSKTDIDLDKIDEQLKMSRKMFPT